MFLLRCAFWLSVVYASMSWGGSAIRHHGSFEAATRGGPAALESAVVERVVGGVADLCRGREVDCARDAAMMTALVQTTVRGADEAAPAGSDASAEDLVVQAEAPLPVPAPRRRVNTRMLTRLP